MTVATQPKLMTIEELLEIPEDVRCELLEGRLVEMSPTQQRHAEVSSALVMALAIFLHDNPIAVLRVGEAGYIVSRTPDTVLVPDLAVISPEQATQRTPDGRGYYPFAPMIAIAVKSPSDREAEIARQLGLYLEGGAQEVWWVRPAERTVAIHRLDDPLELLRSGDTLTTDALPGFALPLAAVFCFAARD